MELDQDLQARQQARTLVARAAQAQKQLAAFSQEKIDAICKAICEAGKKHARRLGQMATEETGFGNADDKAIKNTFAAETVYKAIAPLRTVGILATHPEDKIVDIGVPVGVIAGIVPSTNPTSTVIYKTLISIKGGNAIVFSPHPNAIKCTLEAVDCIRTAAVAAGCPEDAIGCLSIASMDGVKELMGSSGVALILATGGGAMVRAAYSSGRPAIGVGPGNGPAFIHSSADIPQAVRDIVRSKTFDYGTVCASEQSVVVCKQLADTVEAEFQKQGGYFLSTQESEALSKLLLRANGTMNPAIVGKCAKTIAKMAGIQVPGNTRVLIAKSSEVGAKFPYSREKLCPVLAYFVCRDDDAAVELVCHVLENEGSGHTCTIHAKEEAPIEHFALRVPVSRVLVNTPATMGGIGQSTRLFPALTLGCGAAGGSSSSNNIGPLDLINIRRIAWGTQQTPVSTSSTISTIDDALLDAITAKILQKLQ